MVPVDEGFYNHSAENQEPNLPSLHGHCLACSSKQHWPAPFVFLYLACCMCHRAMTYPCHCFNEQGTLAATQSWCLILCATLPSALFKSFGMSPPAEFWRPSLLEDAPAWGALQSQLTPHSSTLLACFTFTGTGPRVFRLSWCGSFGLSSCISFSTQALHCLLLSTIVGVTTSHMFWANGRALGELHLGGLMMDAHTHVKCLEQRLASALQWGYQPFIWWTGSPKDASDVLLSAVTLTPD